ncbi:hypothetical protein GALL_115810 [mine drainage metagenome]|uniref:Haemolysin activator HlyB C-terminal domain-containing protein n=1 Tax=mine drainage metagenome TaxID=410659 RepID=A0A1J5SDD0_9ZZZZ
MKRALPVLFALINCLALAYPLSCRAAQPKEPARTGTARNAVVLKRLLLADTEKRAEVMKDPGEGHSFAFDDLPVFNTQEFRDKMAPFMGQPISNDLVRKMAVVIAAYVREKDLLTVNVAIPKQDASTGVLRLALRIGRYRDIVVKGNRWFSAKQIEDELGVKPGDEIRISQLDQAINWINTNPFRYTKAIINNQTGDPTRADLIIAVQDAAPFRVIGSYDNSGVSILGSDRYTVALQWGNAWGIGHQISYQYSRSDIPRYFQAHSLDYLIPLPWHHQLQIDVAYATFNPTISVIKSLDPSQPDTYIDTKGTNLVGDIHYIIPQTLGRWNLQYSFGVDFKRSDNNLIFGGSPVPINTVDVLQGNVAVTAVRKDKLGGWSFTLSTNLSPGHLTSDQSDSVYANARYGSQPRYAYANFNVQRLTDVGGGWQLVTKLNTQIASTNLQGSEQMSIGGADTVRGYDERIYSGDQGMTFNAELQSPVINARAAAIPTSWKVNDSIQARGLAFFDFGDVKYHDRNANDIQLYSLASAGIGFRCAMGHTLSVSFDYGWRIRKLPARVIHTPGAGRGSIRVSVAY